MYCISCFTRRATHANVVTYITAEAHHDQLFVFTEYMAGGSLRTQVRRFGRLNEKVIQGYMRQTLTGLQYLHSLGVVHRDIKVPCALSLLLLLQLADDLHHSRRCSLCAVLLFGVPAACQRAG